MPGTQSPKHPSEGFCSWLLLTRFNMANHLSFFLTVLGRDLIDCFENEIDLSRKGYHQVAANPPARLFFLQIPQLFWEPVARCAGCLDQLPRFPGTQKHRNLLNSPVWRDPGLTRLSSNIVCGGGWIPGDQPAELTRQRCLNPSIQRVRRAAIASA
jgi:hypothetical protein